MATEGRGASDSPGGRWSAGPIGAPADPVDGGFSLIEVVVALGILAVVMSMTLYSVVQGLALSRDSQERVVASSVVSGVLQDLRRLSLTSAGFDSIPITTQTLPARTVQGVTFELSQTTEWVARGVTSSICNSATNASLILRATVTASWNRAESVSSATLIAPPTGSFSQQNGSLAVRLTSSTAGQGYSGATVTATNVTTSADSYSITTGSDGCAFFAQLPVSSSGNQYRITISSPNGVDSKEQSPSVQTATVGAGQVATVSANFDTGGTLFWAYSPTSPPPAGGMPVSLGNPSQGLQDDLYSTPAQSAASGSVTPIYPDTYDVFAGGCTDADPNGLDLSGSPFYDPATYPALGTSATVPAGGGVTAEVPLYPLNIAVVDTAGAALATAASPANDAPTAIAGASGLSGGASCPNGAPSYTLTPVANGASSTGVGLGHLTINVSVDVGGSTRQGSVNVWVRPDGVYNVDSNGNATTEIYSFTGGGSVPVPVS